ncbi:hypothetical protein niasHS_000001 [Heterodera schachtii]|uniref:Uncharacterized protein n=1 Tax=Heterodera schachtii TaxID=97005 RepID=A0ABD2KNJ2_HETSC
MKILRKNALFVAIFFLFACVFLWFFLSPQNKGPNGLPLRPLLLFYNRIPKTGSTTFVNAIAYDLSTVNGFHVAHLNLTKNRYQMNAIDQARLVRNLTNWQRMHPLFLHGHFAFIDFERFGLPPPIWINLLREPFDRFVSYFYFLRYGDNFRVGLRRSKAGNNETFDECFRRGGRECDPSAIWLQIPYFCGTAHFCSIPGNAQALQLAKRNLLDHFLLVGLTERIEETVLLLEQLLPAFFRGAGEHFRLLNEDRKSLRHTLRKFPPTIETLRKFKQHKVYQMEREFYDFGKAEFELAWKRSIEEKENDEEGKGRKKQQKFMSRQFHFEKIKRRR